MATLFFDNMVHNNVLVLLWHKQNFLKIKEENYHTHFLLQYFKFKRLNFNLLKAKFITTSYLNSFFFFQKAATMPMIATFRYVGTF